MGEMIDMKQSFISYETSPSPLSEIRTATLILHIQHPFCQSHSVKGSPKHTHPWVAPLFSSLQLTTGTSCNKHSHWTVLSPSLHLKTQSWTFLLTDVAACHDVLLSLPSCPLCCCLEHKHVLCCCHVVLLPCCDAAMLCCYHVVVMLCHYHAVFSCVAAMLCCGLRSLYSVVLSLLS